MGENAAFNCLPRAQSLERKRDGVTGGENVKGMGMGEGGVKEQHWNKADRAGAV